MDAFAKDLGDHEAPDMLRVTRQRISIFQIFQSHMERKNKAVARLRQCGFPHDAVAILKAHDEATRDLFLRYSDHTRVWTPDRIKLDWAGYRAAVIALQQLAHDRLSWEEDVLHPLLKRAGAMAA